MATKIKGIYTKGFKDTLADLSHLHFSISISQGTETTRAMAKSNADDEELRRACKAAIEGTKQKIVMSICVAKSRGVRGKSEKLGRQMANPRVLALSTKSKATRTKAFLRVLKYSTGGVLEDEAGDEIKEESKRESGEGQQQQQ